MIRCVLMDIEGTIIPVTFVRDVLFPYAQRRLPAFLQQQRESSAVRQWVDVCQDTVAQETGKRPAYEELFAILGRWIEEDRKHPGLKALQGMIWQEGYRTGAFAPELYRDVAPALARWRRKGTRMALYSSGSEQAQRLLVEHTTDGNLTEYFAAFFDTRIGAKTETPSYLQIADRMTLHAEELLFLSDIEQELDAAAAAGLRTTHIVRPGTRPGTRHLIRATFAELDGEGSIFNEMIAP